MIAIRRWSLQSLLVALAVTVTLLAWATGAAVVWRVAEHHTQELHDGQLRHMAHLLLGLSGHELIEIGADTPMAARIANGQADGKETLGDDYRYQLWTSDGKLLLTNFGAPSGAAMAKLGHTGYSWLDMDGERWRVYAYVDTTTSQEMQVAECMDLRSWVPGSLDAQLAGWVAASMGLVLLPTIFLQRRMLRPLRELAAQLSLRSPSKLASVQINGAPTELVPIVQATNGLFKRMSEALSRERNFTSLAAHELRTPLAALRLQAQVAGTTEDDDIRSRNLRDLVRSVDRCAHMQDQLLTLARLDIAKSSELEEPVHLTDIAMEAASEKAPLARRKKIHLTSHSDGSTIRGHAFGVRTLVRNLLSNALRYTPEDGRVEISIRGIGANVCLRVDDSGPGIAADQRERAFERFERLNAVSSEGVGLGLSIVRSVAEAHGAEVTLGDSALGGLCVTVRFVGRRLDQQDPPVLTANDTLATTTDS